LAFPPGYLAQLTRANPRDLSIIGVKGDSMLPTLADDDLVMIDRTKKDLSFDGLFVIRDGGDALLIKRIGRASRRGFVSIISDNRAVYPAVEKPLDEVEVIGRVIWKGGKV
jgi:phage repressor protein C with HTH and peptisase S24 domain